jgi:hypothetical protein
MRQKLWVHAGDEHMLNMSIEDVLTAAGFSFFFNLQKKFIIFFF